MILNTGNGRRPPGRTNKNGCRMFLGDHKALIRPTERPRSKITFRLFYVLCNMYYVLCKVTVYLLFAFINVFSFRNNKQCIMTKENNKRHRKVG